MAAWASARIASDWMLVAKAPSWLALHSSKYLWMRSADGRETAWGRVLTYEPPHRLTFTWIVGLSAEYEQLIELRFAPEGDGTRVELTHSGWEKLGDAAAALRERYDRGWATLIERCYADYVNPAAT